MRMGITLTAVFRDNLSQWHHSLASAVVFVGETLAAQQDVLEPINRAPQMFFLCLF